MKRANSVTRSIVVAVGIGLVSYGSYSLMPAEADTLSTQSFEWSTPLVKMSQGSIFAGTVPLNNLAPGDTIGGSLTITNSGKEAEWVQLDNKLSGGGDGHPDIFADYPHSVDASMGEPTDDNPATLSYSISISGWNGNASLIQVGPFSVSDISPPFKLRQGQTATINYMLRFPLAAHNDYQGATGSIKVNVVYSPDIDGDHGVQGGTQPASAL